MLYNCLMHGSNIFMAWGTHFVDNLNAFHQVPFKSVFMFLHHRPKTTKDRGKERENSIPGGVAACSGLEGVVLASPPSSSEMGVVLATEMDVRSFSTSKLTSSATASLVLLPPTMETASLLFLLCSTEGIAWFFFTSSKLLLELSLVFFSLRCSFSSFEEERRGLWS